MLIHLNSKKISYWLNSNAHKEIKHKQVQLICHQFFLKVCFGLGFSLFLVFHYLGSQISHYKIAIQTKLKYFITLAKYFFIYKQYYSMISHIQNYWRKSQQSCPQRNKRRAKEGTRRSARPRKSRWSGKWSSILIKGTFRRHAMNWGRLMSSSRMSMKSYLIPNLRQWRKFRSLKRIRLTKSTKWSTRTATKIFIKADHYFQTRIICYPLPIWCPSLLKIVKASNSHQVR